MSDKYWPDEMYQSLLAERDALRYENKSLLDDLRYARLEMNDLQDEAEKNQWSDGPV